jgi:uncharacterized protein YecA (UPF0149 family)
LTIIKLYAIVLLGLLVSCSKTRIDDSLLAYNKRFETIAKECDIDLNSSSLEFTNSDEKLYGWCQYYPNGIKISVRGWSELPRTTKEQLIFHEMGHCRLDQPHDDEDLNVMNTVGFIDRQTYIKYYDYFIRKLFVGCKTPLFKKFKYKDIK